jgi:hypothetical protein
LSTTNPTRLDLGRRGGKPATNRLSYGAGYVSLLLERQILSLNLVKRKRAVMQNALRSCSRVFQMAIYTPVP